MGARSTGVTPFVGSSAMAARMQRFAWTDEPPGLPQDWPAALQAACRIALTSRFPMIVWWGPALRFFYNDAYAPLLGAKHPAALGRPGSQVWSEIWHIVGPMLQGVLDTGEATWSDDVLLPMERHGYWEETYWTFSYSPLHDDDAVNGVFTAVTDTTQRVVGERRLAALQDLGAQAGRARTVAEACELVLAALQRADADVAFAALHLLDGAAGFRAPVGLDPAPLTDGPGAWPLDAALERTVEVSDVVPRYGELPGGAWDRPPTEALLLPLRGETGAAPLGVIVLGASAGRMLDEPYRRFLELVAAQVSALLNGAAAVEAQRERAERLAELDAAKTAFFSNVSHEFRTPLTLITAPLQELRERPELEEVPGVAVELERVHRNALRLGRLVNTLLDFSRLQAGRLQARFEPVEVGPVTAELASGFREVVERAGLEFRIACDDIGEPVQLDRAMWEKVVFNLLSNAVKYTFTGSIAVELHRDPEGPGEAVLLRVADTGIGVPAGELPRLFERFHRVEGAKARSMEGSGIGLALVHDLVELHGGTVTARSTLGAGTEFRVRIPLGTAHLPPEQLGPPLEGEVNAAGEANAAGEVNAAEPFVAEALRWLPDPAAGTAAPAEERPAGPVAGRVLVADDNADMRDYLTRLLAPLYGVTTVRDGRAALDAALADPPDLLISDVMMPELDGLGLLAALRADERTVLLPVLLLSARAGQDAALQGLASGADDYLVKPFSGRELLARVDAHLRLDRVRRSAERRFSAMADLAPALVWVADADGRRIYVNAGYTAFTGSDPAAAAGEGWVEALHPDDKSEYLAGYAADVAAGRPWQREYRLRDADGAYRWVLENAVPTGDGSGVVASAVDVHARYRESERQTLLARLGAELAAGTAEEIERGLERAVALLVEVRLADHAAVRLREVDSAGVETAMLRRVAAASDGRSPAAGPESAAASPAAAEALATGLPVLQQSVAGDREITGGVVLPLHARGGMRGVLTVDRRRDGAGFDAADLGLLQEIAVRMGTALDNALLLAEERATARRLDLLQRATAELSAAATPEQVVDVTRRHLAGLLGTPAVGVWESEGMTLRATALDGWDRAIARDWATLPIDGATPVADAARERRVVLLGGGADWEDAYPHLTDIVAASGYRSLAVWPLVVAGEGLGALAVGFDRPRVLGPAERATALALAEQCGQAVARSRLLRAESDARQDAVRLGSALAALSAAIDLRSVAGVLIEQVVAMGAAAAVVALRSDDHLDVVAATGFPGRSPRRLTATGPLAVDRSEPLWTVTPGATWGQPTESYPVQTVLPLHVAGGHIGSIGLIWGEGTPGEDERPLLVTLAGQGAQALDRARLQQAEHEVAVSLQRVLLPAATPSLQRLAVATRYLPGAAGTVAGGDWYDVIPLSDGRVAIVVGDVVGHGPRAAAVMGQLRSALAAYLLDDHGPAEALERLDRFSRRVDGATASTVACMVLDRESGALTWAGAGHVPALVIDDTGSRFLVTGSGTVLGVRGRPPFVEERTVLATGACVLLYTDGLVERRGEDVDAGLGRLERAAVDLHHHDPERLATALLARCLGDGPSDDVALVVIRLLPPPLENRIPADPAELATMRRDVRGWARDAALHQAQLEDLQLTLGEAVANAVEHAYEDREPGEVGYRLEVTTDGGIAVEVRDSGRWRPPPADPGHRGRGLLIIERLAHDVAVEGTDAGTLVRFVLPPP